ncbi:hypothetical protein ASPFODRAFT_60976 [Aspergillus luchuensis CBS 106.47]|uniref:SnoaL-like domain-containing protein n=1 Tax=Aspergillus luchuensis (strain CBS 106.47) TaxID=1137211 RepID=A0A1M3TFN7_ASPLC|nr:hypothetical protein ASPFODRAFT_60976 [Aspergillus luchuensis CBS 106.47]
MSQTNTNTHLSLTATITTYFTSIDASDPPPRPSNTTFTGRDAIYTILSDFVSRSAKIEHQIQTVVVDERAGKVATQQRYLGKLVDGTEKDMLTCNFFDVDDQGKIERVVF